MLLSCSDISSGCILSLDVKYTSFCKHSLAKLIWFCFDEDRTDSDRGDLGDHAEELFLKS